MGIGVPRAGTPGGPGALAGGRARGPLCPARADGDLSAPLKPYQQDWRHSPRSQTPLKPHIALRGEDRTTTCAFLGNPRPAATVYKGGRQHHGQLQVLVQVHQQSVHDLHPHLHAPGGRRVKRAGGDKPGKPRRNCNLSTARTLRWLDLAAGGGAACVASGPEAQNGRVVGCRSTLKMAGAGF